MMSGSSSVLLLGFLVAILAVECSSTNGYQESVGRKGKNLSRSKAGKDESLHTYATKSHIATAYANYGRKILEGRKHLPGMDQKPIHISPGKIKPDNDPENSFQELENKESDQIDAKVKKDGLKGFLEAVDQVANLMRKDYTGAGRGRRKPPINNQEPKD